MYIGMTMISIPDILHARSIITYRPNNAIRGKQATITNFKLPSFKPFLTK